MDDIKLFTKNEKELETLKQAETIKQAEMKEFFKERIPWENEKTTRNQTT